MFRFNVNKKFGSAFVIFISIMFILFGLSRIILGLFGERDTAVITNIRRQGGQRNESVPNRYTYVISYSFSLPDGKIIDGFTYKIGNAVYVKASGTSLVPVRYLKALPGINALESDSGFKMGNIIIIGAGILMFMFTKPKSRSKKRIYKIKKRGD